MNERTLKSFVVGLVVLIGIWVATLVLGGTGGTPAAESGVPEALAAVDAASLSSISIVTPRGDTIDLVRTGGRWSANGYPADTAAIARVRGALEEASVGSVVATNPDNHARMGVGADSTWTVAMEGGGATTTFLIGDTGPSFSTAYVRVVDEDPVVLVEGGLRGALARPLNDWRDRTIFRVDTARVTRIRVERDPGGTVIERGEDGWTIDGESARETTVQNLLREAVRFAGSGFKDPDAPLFEGNERRTVLEDAEGAVLAEVRFLGNGTTQHATVPGSEMVFEVQNWKADRLTPTRALALPPDPGG